MWTWEISTGRLFTDAGVLAGVGYAGRNAGKNNPQLVDMHKVGPIPPGLYSIRPPENTTTHGDYVLWLIADPNNVMYDRSGFGIHGDRRPHAGEPYVSGMASEGCIVLPLDVRKQIWESNDHDLQVVSGPISSTYKA